MGFTLRVFLLSLVIQTVFTVVGYGQCKKATSTCDLTGINTAFTPTSTYLGCSTDSCSLYYYFPTSVSADSIENWAQSLGAHLTSITSQAENDSITKWSADAGLTGPVWIGLNDKNTEGIFVWTDGADTTYKNWKTSHPTVDASKNCVALFVTGADSGMWVDTTCTALMPGIVKVSLCMSTSTTSDTVCAGSSGTIYTMPMGGSGGYTYAWSNSGSTTDTVMDSPAASTVYNVTVSDRYSCSVIDSGSIQIDTLPSFDLGDTVTTCNTIPKELDAGAGPYSYLWSSGKTFQKDTVVVQGYHWATRTDTNTNCSFTDSVWLRVDPRPNFFLGGDTNVCEGDTATIKPSVIDSSASYLWHDASTDFVYKTDTTELVSVTVTNTFGCTRTDSRLVVRTANPVLNLANDTTVCEDQTFTIPGPLGFLSTRWIIGTDTTYNPDKVADKPGEYKFYGLDTNSCPGHDTVNVAWNLKPVIVLGNDTSICQFDTITLSVDTFYASVEWLPGLDTTFTKKVSAPNNYSAIVTDTNGCVGSGGIVIANDTLPQVQAMRNGLPGDTSICNLDSIYLHNVVNDTTWEYSWNGSAFVKGNDTLVVNSANKYVLTVRDTNTCIGMDSLNVTIDSLPVVNLTNDTTICFGDSVLLTSNPDTNYSHVWDGVNLGKQDTMWVSLDTTYKLTLIDRNTTCRATDSVVITHDTLPQINLGVDTGFCTGDSIILDAGANYLSYQWSTSSLDTLRNLTVKSAGAYTVNVVDQNLCKGSDTRVIVENLLPTPNLGPDQEFCFGTPVNVPLDAGPGFSYYRWSSGRQGIAAVAQNDTALVQGIHWVEVTDSNSCKNRDSVLINASFLPTIDLGPDTSFCSGDKFNFLVNAGAGFVKYEWFEAKSGAPVSLPTTGQILLVKDSSSVVICRITDTKGCTNSDTLEVKELTLPIITFNQSKYCESDRRFFSENVDADPTQSYASYKWSTGDTTRVITVTEGGNYIVTVTGHNTCKNSETKEVIEIPQPNIDWNADSVLCKGTTLTLDATKPGYVHYWWYKTFDDGRADSLMNPMLPPPIDTVPDTTVTSMNIIQGGSYKVYTRYFESPFCYDSAFADVRDDIYPEIDFGVASADTTMCVGETLVLSPNFSGSSTKNIKYLWHDGSEDSIYIARETGLYSLSLTNDCGADIDDLYITFDDCSNIYVPNAFTPNGDGDNDIWKIVSLQRYISFELQVFDRYGNVIWETNNPEVSWDGTHQQNGEVLPVGTYVFKLSYRSDYEFIDGVNSAPTRTIEGLVNIVK